MKRTGILRSFLLLPSLCLPFFLSTLVSSASAFDPQELVEQMAAMPRPDLAAPVAGALPFDPADINHDCWFKPAGERVVMTAVVNKDRGPDGGLEGLIAMPGGKVHETYLTTRTSNAELIKVAMLAAFNLPYGRPAMENSAVPAVGVPMNITVWWQPDALLAPEQWESMPASCFVRDTEMGAYPPLPYVYTGSRITNYEHQLPNGEIHHRERFMLNVTQSVAANYDNPDALLASPFPLSFFDIRFEVNDVYTPAVGQPVYVVYEAIELPLQLTVEDGVFIHAGVKLDTSALSILLAQHYAAKDNDLYRAVEVLVPQDVSSDQLIDYRREVLAAAAGKCWVVPLFNFAPDKSIE